MSAVAVEEGQKSPGKLTFAGYTDIALGRDISSDPEPTHGYCTRCLLAALSVFSVASALFLLTHYVLAPLEYIGFVCAKCVACNFCCPASVGRTFRNILLSPIRWARLAATGAGHIECWTHPTWPFRPASKPYTS